MDEVTRHWTSSLNSLRIRVWIVVTCALLLLTGCSGSSEEEGGVIGTGITLEGTASENRALASKSVEIKARSGERSTTQTGAGSRYMVSSVAGTGPWLLRTDLGNNEYHYGISFGSKIANIHSYTDLILRNWFVLENRDIDTVFANDGPLLNLPTQVEFATSAASVFKLVDLALDSYEVSGEQLLSASFDADDTGIDRYLDNNPVIIEGILFNIVLTDPDSRTQSTTRSILTLADNLSVSDTEPPQAPGSVRVLGSASDQIIVVWDPAIDNQGVTGYRIYRDGSLVQTTPYPVFTDTELQSNSVYNYEIEALDAAGNVSARSVVAMGSTLSAPDTMAPPAPTRLTQLLVTSQRVDLIWGQSDIGDVVSFNIYRGATATSMQLLLKVTSTLVTDVTVSGGTTYCYQISALDASGNESPRGDVLCVDTIGEFIPTLPDGGLTVPPFAGLSVPDTASIDCPLELTTSLFTENTTLDEPCYVVRQDMEIGRFVNLSIAPGTILKFSEGTKLLVGKGASFTSSGTPESPVVLTGLQQQPGYWSGIVFNRSNNPANLIRHTVIEYAGAGDNDAGLLVLSSLGEKARIRVENSLIRLNSRYGISFPSLGTVVDAFTGNLVTQNLEPAFINLESLAFFGNGNDFSGNEEQIIDVPRLPTSANVVIPDLGVPMLSNGITMLQADLTIRPGVEMRFLGESGIQVDGDLVASGTVEKPILLTGYLSAPGQWQGVHISNSDNNVLENITIEYAGKPDALRNAGAALYLKDASASLSNVTLTGSSSYGFYTEGDEVEFSRFENVTSTENAQTGYTHMSNLGNLSASVTMTGNDVDVVDVVGPQIKGVDAVWPDIGVPYRLYGVYRVETGSVTLSAGVSIIGGGGAQLQIARDAWLSAIGTPDNPITLTGELAVPGHWGGLVFNSDDASNVLDHVVIENAGGVTAVNADSIQNGAIRLGCTEFFPASVSISNTDIITSGSFGLFLEESGCTVNLGVNVRFINNTLGDSNM